MTDQTPRPPFDPAYKNATGYPDPDKVFDIPKVRLNMQNSGMDAQSIAAKHPAYQHTDIQIPRPSDPGKSALTLALYQVSPDTPALKHWPNGRPVLYYVHGGGQVSGDRFFGPEFAMDHFRSADNMVFASPEYRLAPDYPAPAGALDVYAGLVYLVEHASELGIDATKIILNGVSGGAGVSASAALISRKRGGPKCCALVLDIPMLDDRGAEYASAKQFRDGTFWTGWQDEAAWKAILGDWDETDTDGERVAARADSLAGLPPTFIDVGECECMRDQAVAFASRIWRDGGSAELHVWPGVYHGATMFEPGVPVSEGMISAQRGFLRRVLGFSKQSDHVEEVKAANL